MDCSPPGSSVHGILQARILEWVAISFSRGSSQTTDGTRVSWIAGRFFIVWASRGAYYYWFIMKATIQEQPNPIEEMQGQGTVAGELPWLFWVHYPSRTSMCSPIQKPPKSHSLGGLKRLHYLGTINEIIPYWRLTQSQAPLPRGHRLGWKFQIFKGNPPTLYGIPWWLRW